jgi:hypothetical protein
MREVWFYIIINNANREVQKCCKIELKWGNLHTVYCMSSYSVGHEHALGKCTLPVVWWLSSWWQSIFMYSHPRSSLYNICASCIWEQISGMLLQHCDWLHFVLLACLLALYLSIRCHSWLNDDLIRPFCDWLLI